MMEEPRIAASTMSSFARHLRLWRACFRLALVRESQFRANVLTTVATGLAQIMVGLVPILLLFSYTEKVDGWSRADAIVILGVYQVTAALISIFVSRNMYEISEAITRGTLDVVLVRPVDAQFYLTTRWIRPERLFSLAAGLVIVVVGLTYVGTWPTPLNLLQGAVLLLAGLVLISCCWSWLAYCAFWSQSVDAMMMFFQDLQEVGRYPISFFPWMIRLIFTALVPVAFLTTFPAAALTDGVSWWLVLGAVGFAIVAVAVTRWFWEIAVRRYAGASS
jgi:ABC-2 type transport system permease protein